MGRSIWNGSINFGLVSIPVEMFSTTKDQSVHFHIVTKDGTCRLRQKLYCPKTNKEYEFKDTAKGFETGPDRYVTFDRKELESLKPKSGNALDILDFVSIDEIDPIYFQASYYLAPAKKSLKTYRLLHQSMRAAGKVGVAKLVMRQKEYLTVIRPLEECLCLETMHYDKEIVQPKTISQLGAYINSSAKASPKELNIAKQLIDSLTGKFDASDYEDEYTKLLKKRIQDRSKGKHIETDDEPEEKADNVIDIIEALKRSLASPRKPSKSSKTVKKTKASNARGSRSKQSRRKAS